MELRWLTPDEQRRRTVESSSLADVLALAQMLQAEAEGRVEDQQVVEMGRELGVRPEYVQEALRLRRHPSAPRRPLLPGPAVASAADSSALGLGSALALGFGLGTLPLALDALGQMSRSNAGPVALFAFVAAIVAGWSVRHPRQGAVAAALVTTAVFLAGAAYLGPDMPGGTFLLMLLSFTALASGLGRSAARLRRWTERLADRPSLTVSEP